MSIDQISAEVNWAGFNSRTVALTNVAAGASIFVVNCMTNFGGGLTSIGCSGVNDGTAYTNDGATVNPVNSAPQAVEVWRLHNAAAGTHNIVLTSSQANSNNFGRIIAFSWTGLQNAAPDVPQVNNHANSSTPQTGSSSALSQSGELIIAAMVLAATDPSPAFTSPANTGYTSLMNIQTTGNLPASADYQHVTVTTPQSANWGTITGGNEQWSALLLAYKDVVSGSNPIITSVGTGTIQQGQTGVTISGSNFGSNTGSAAITLIDGANASLTAACSATSWGASSIQFTVNGGNVRNGSATIKVTTSGGLTASFGVTLNPPTGTSFQTLGSLKALAFDQNGTPSRLTDSPDITNNEQLEFTMSGGTGTVTVTPDGNMSWPTTVTQIAFRHHNGAQWSALSHWDLRGLFPQSTGQVPGQNVVSGAAISLSLANYFSESDAATLPLLYSIGGSGLPTGASINSSTGAITGTVSAAAGTYSGIIPQVTNADGSIAQGPAFAVVVAANSNVAFSGTIQNYPNLTAGQAFTLDTTAFFTNATSYSETGTLPAGLTYVGGILAGVLTGAGITVGTSTAYSISVTGSNPNPSSANSNSFTLTVNNPVVMVTPTQTAGTFKSSQLQSEEKINSLLAYQVFESIATLVLGSKDAAGTVYRFFRLPASARILEQQIMNDGNPFGSNYKLGLLLPNGGSLIVAGSDSILLPTGTSLDVARPYWTNLYTPIKVNTAASVANVGKRLWELLGLPQDPSPASQDQLYDVCMTAVTPGSLGGNVALRIAYLRGPDRGLITAAGVQ